MVEKNNLAVVRWHALSVPESLGRLGVGEATGLLPDEAKARLKNHGPNRLDRYRSKSIFYFAWQQFKSPLVFILLVAGIATLLLEEYPDASVIFVVVVINTVIGVFQERKASKVFEKLAQSQEHSATVLRGGQKSSVKADTLVPGDIIFLAGGELVPADCRIIKANRLEANESSLTGEWIEVEKSEAVVDGQPRITEQSNMLWQGTLVAGGMATAVVVATGRSTELGKIAETMSGESTTQTPFQKNISQLAKFLGGIISVAIVGIFLVGIWRGVAVGEMILTSIAVAVAAVPSGLPIAVTIVLAIGLENILKKGGLVKSLPAAETLGSTTVILTDKTGTLTEAHIQVESVFSLLDDKSFNHEVLRMAVVASDAVIEQAIDGETEFVITGRPIEKAIIERGITEGMNQRMLAVDYKRLDFFAFDPANRFAASLNDTPDGKKVFVTGAPETIIKNSTMVWTASGKVAMTSDIREKLLAMNDDKAGQGVRVIAVGYKETDWDKFPADSSAVGRDLVFAGFIGLHDPLRADVPEAIAKAKLAGAKVIMVTGDNEMTARHIAEKLGIMEVGDRVVRGDELESMSAEEIAELSRTVKVFARMLPAQKLAILNALLKDGEVVAMTGDGVNDAPALKNASIGVALGSGTDVAKEAADMVLVSDNFSIIVLAIEEGRRILDNLKKIVAYLLSTGFSEIIVVGGSLLVGAPLPVLPTQILWTNVVEEGFMSFAFAFEPKEDGVLKRDPQSREMKAILTTELKKLIFIITAVTGALSLLVYFFLLRTDLPIEEIRTVMFAVISMDSLLFTFSLKNLHRPIWKIKLWDNIYLLFAFFASLAFLLVALFVPVIQNLLHIVPLTLFDFSLIVLVGLANLATIEVAKYFALHKFGRVKN